MQKTVGEHHFLSDARWRKEIGVARFIRCGAKICDLDVPHLDQRVDTIVDGAKANPELAGDVALSAVRLLLKQTQRAEADIFAKRFMPLRHFVWWVDGGQNDSYRTSRESLRLEKVVALALLLFIGEQS